MANRKNPAAVALGRLGGLVKGRKGLAAMTPKKREEIRQAALAARRNKATGGERLGMARRA